MTNHLILPQKANRNSSYMMLPLEPSGPFAWNYLKCSGSSDSTCCWALKLAPAPATPAATITTSVLGIKS